MNNYRHWIALIGLLLFGILLLPVGYAADQASTTQVVAEYVSGQDRQAIQAIAATLVAGRDKTDEVLQSVGFSDIARTIPGFADWPALRKIEAGYLSAVAAGGSDEEGAKEGAEFLRAISLEIAENHSNAIRYEATLQPHFAEPAAESHVKIKFAPLAQNPDPPKDVNVREAIMAIERYVSRVPGGMPSAMLLCCGIKPPDNIYKILRSSRNNVEALTQAIEKGDLPPVLKERLIRLIKTVAETSHAVFYEAALDTYLNSIDTEFGEPSGLAQRDVKLPPTMPESMAKTDEEKVRNLIADAAKQAGVDNTSASKLAAAAFPSESQPPASIKPDNPPPAPSTETSFPQAQGGGGGGGGPDTFERNLDRFENVTRSIKPPPKERPLPRGSGGLPKFSFSAMRVGGGGFGGVVFGSPVDGTKVDKPTKLFWVYDVKADSPNDDWGHFDVVLGTDTVASTRRFHSADAYAAWEIVAGREGTFAPLDVARGEGVGLASVVQDNKLMVVHPAIYGLAIGDAAALADAIGFKMSDEAFSRHLSDAGVPAQIIKKAEAWHSADSGYYKIIDTPLVVRNNGGIIRVARSDDSAYDNKLKAVAFLDFQPFKPFNEWTGEAMPSESLPFYDVLPALITVFPAFERLNSFSEILALIRWASASRATIKPPEPPKTLPARLYIHKLPDGDITQLEQELTTSQKAAGKLARERKDAEELKATLRKAGASNPALMCIDQIDAVKSDIIRIKSAIDEVERQLEHDEKQSEAIVGKLLEDGQSRLESLKDCSSKEDMLTLMLDRASAEQLSKLRKDLEAAKAKSQQSDEAVVEAAYENAVEQIAMLPEVKRKLAEAAVQRLNVAEEKLRAAKTPAAEEAAIKEGEAAFKQLEDLLPPPDTAAAVESARQVALEDQEAMEAAREALDAEVTKMMPAWLDKNWSAIKKFLPSQWSLLID